EVLLVEVGRPLDRDEDAVARHVGDTLRIGPGDAGRGRALRVLRERLRRELHVEDEAVARRLRAALIGRRAIALAGRVGALAVPGDDLAGRVDRAVAELARGGRRGARQRQEHDGTYPCCPRANPSHCRRRKIPARPSSGAARYSVPCMPNVFEPEWDAEQDKPPFRWRRSRVGRQAGGEKLGASVFELEPGTSSFPLHVHYANEELLVVLAGPPTLRTLGGERTLAPGGVVAFTSGRRGAHRIDNRSDAPGRFLIVRTMISPQVNA